MANKTLFVACPIGPEGSPERKRSDELLEFVIGPAANELDYNVIRGDRIGEPGRITLQIARELGSSDVVVADLTGPNANVMYEVGVRQALGRPLILMAQKGQALPFDLLDFRTIFFELSLSGAKEARKELLDQLTASEAGTKDYAASRTLFGLSESQPSGNGAVTDDQVLSAVYGTYERIVRESEETRDTLEKLRLQIAALAETQQQAFAMQMMSGLLEQGMQNPDKLEKFMSVVQAFQPEDNKPSPAPSHASKQVMPKRNKGRR